MLPVVQRREAAKRHKGLNQFPSSQLRSLGELSVILRDAKHYRLSVRVRHLHPNRASFLGPISPIIGIVS